ncbi:MAG: AraC family transcriptional regulator [Gemmatimonadota bacterium]
MATVAVLTDSRRALQTVRKSMPRGGPSVVLCRSAPALFRVLESRLVDAIVFSPQDPHFAIVRQLRATFPDIPTFALAAFRPDEGELLLACHREQVAGVLVEGVDDAVAGDLVQRASATADRRRQLHDAPRALRLLEPLQRDTWNLLLDTVDRPVRTAALARRLRVSREHLSRQFGAGGAPNLKRVIDLTRIACAAHLLGNPGYDPVTVAKILRFSSSSHLSGTARRIANSSTRALGELGPRGVLAAFVGGNTRSRVG